ncbi:heme-degrading domain-containing protein [Brucella gallinifaecis]|uniref:UPF0303 protein FHY56_03925 n=1 Tax=Brucella gallinifaecis TaxID=215590 RepID=A0A502BSI8_9HYPH|nr:heme-degrading domain-containing protein [Brucella gallinifaecis]TPF76649.1 heme-degrading domain-containing protein [Brucella gallinifaecis]
MAQSDDIKQIIRQEQALIFRSFDEDDAFSLGYNIRELAVKQQLSVAIDISLWDRRLFFAATAGTTSDNSEWLRHKFNVVRRFHVSSYRLVLEQDREDKIFAAHKALDVADYALAGGGFPINVRKVGVIGAAIVSGLPQCDDHNLVVRAIAEHLEQDPVALALADALFRDSYQPVESSF